MMPRRHRRFRRGDASALELFECVQALKNIEPAKRAATIRSTSIHGSPIRRARPPCPALLAVRYISAFARRVEVICRGEILHRSRKNRVVLRVGSETVLHVDVAHHLKVNGMRNGAIEHHFNVVAIPGLTRGPKRSGERRAVASGRDWAGWAARSSSR